MCRENLHVRYEWEICVALVTASAVYTVYTEEVAHQGATESSRQLESRLTVTSREDTVTREEEQGENGPSLRAPVQLPCSPLGNTILQPCALKWIWLPAFAEIKYCLVSDANGRTQKGQRNQPTQVFIALRHPVSGNKEWNLTKPQFHGYGEGEIRLRPRD